MKTKNHPLGDLFSDESPAQNESLTNDLELYREPAEKIRKEKRKEAIIAKSKDVSENDQIEKEKNNIQNAKDDTNFHYDNKKVSLDQRLNSQKQDLDEKKKNFDDNIDADIENSNTKKAKEFHSLDRQTDSDKELEKDVKKDKELLEEDHKQAPVIDMKKVFAVRVFSVILFIVIAYVGFHLNLDFFTLLVGVSGSAIILSIIFGLVDSWIAHRIGALIAEKKIVLAKAYSLVGCTLLIIIFVGQNAALEVEDKYDSFIINPSLTNTAIQATDGSENTDNVRTDLLRGGLILFLFILSAATGYEYQNYRTKLLPFIEIKKFKKKLSSIKERIAKSAARKSILHQELKAEARKNREDEIESIKLDIKRIELTQAQMDNRRKQDINSLENLEKLIISDIKQIYSN